MKTIGLCCDHAGFEMKEIIKKYLTEQGFDIKDFGTYSEESCDYPDFAHPMAEALERGELGIGFSFCGSGNGISMTLNKHQKIRAALAWNTELARLARAHNDANILSMPARFIDDEMAKKMADIFLNTPFDGGRHQRRVDKISLK